MQLASQELRSDPEFMPKAVKQVAGLTQLASQTEAHARTGAAHGPEVES